MMPDEILIVDDQKGVRRLLEELFKKTGWMVYTAADGIEAIAQLDYISPHVILMDMKMPNLNGLEAAQKILKANPKQLIILMTAYGEMDIVSRALHIGVKKCITKPFDIMSLHQIVQEMVKGPSPSKKKG